MIEKCERYCLRVIEGEESGFVAKTVLRGLGALSLGYKAAANIRSTGFKRGLFSVYTAPVPVISIGNLVAGGTGKTPLTIKLAEELSRDYQVAILTRGYRSEQEKAVEPALLFDKEDVKRFGDEACLMAKRLPSALIVVGKDRVQGAILAAKQGAEIIILDDGMQHRKLSRDFEIVVLDQEDPWGLNHFLPRGFLRESPKALGRANLIVINHWLGEKEFIRLRKEIRRVSRAEIVAMRPVTKADVDLAGVAVGLVSGIAKPKKFEKRLEAMGAKVVAKHLSLDHLSPEKEALEAFADEAKMRGAVCLVCTEKDFVKLSKPKALPLVVVKMDLEIALGEAEWNQCVSQVKEMVVQA